METARTHWDDAHDLYEVLACILDDSSTAMLIAKEYMSSCIIVPPGVWSDIDLRLRILGADKRDAVIAAISRLAEDISNRRADGHTLAPCGWPELNVKHREEEWLLKFANELRQD